MLILILVLNLDLMGVGQNLNCHRIDRHPDDGGRRLRTGTRAQTGTCSFHLHLLRVVLRAST